MKPKFSYLYIAIAIMLPALLIISLFYFSEKPNSKKNGFNRNFGSVRVRQDKSALINLNNPRISGILPGKFYFYDKESGDFLMTDQNFKHDDVVNISHPNTNRLQSKLIATSNYLHLIVPSNKEIIKFNHRVERINSFKSLFALSECVLISEDKFGTTLIHASSLGTTKPLSILRTDTQYILTDTSILEPIYDGGFYNDGILNYDVVSGKLVYLFHYRNEFQCMDTNMIKLYTGKTIDTFSTTTLQVVKTKNKVDTNLWDYTLAKPPIFINRRSFAFDNKLYVCSALMADNEDSETFNNSTTIDVYNLRDSKYLGSFYIPIINGKRETDITIYKNKLLILTESYARLYTIEFSNLP